MAFAAGVLELQFLHALQSKSDSTGIALPIIRLYRNSNYYKSDLDQAEARLGLVVMYALRSEKEKNQSREPVL
jgi:hypothetical protein